PTAARFVLFGMPPLYATTVMSRRRRMACPSSAMPARTATLLGLGGQYEEQSKNAFVKYEVTRSPATLFVTYFAGIVSGLLGVGGGIIYVPTMNLVSKIPVNVASATSNFMIGVTAAASA